MTLQQFIQQTNIEEPVAGMCIRPRIICNNGFSISIQASAFHYSKPKAVCEIYEFVEVGFPSEKEDSLMPHCEGEGEPTETVYGYVPFDTVAAIIEKHGGIDTAKTFNN